MGDQLPASPLGDFVTRAKAHRRPVSGNSSGYLKFNGKTGDWEFGQECADVSDESVLINAASFQHGFTRWGSNPPAKVSVSIADALPEPPESIDGTDYEGKPTVHHAQASRAFSGSFEDGVPFQFNINSQGGVERTEGLIDLVMNRARPKKDGGNPEYCFPKVKLESDMWKRPATGKIFKPVYTLVEWCDINGEAEGKVKPKLEKPDAADAAPEPDADAAPEPDADAAPEPKLKRKRIVV